MSTATKRKPKPKPKPTANPASKPPPHLPPHLDALLNTEQVRAALGGISERTLRTLVSAKRFPAADVPLSSQLPCWRTSTVNKWIEDQATKPRT